MSATLLASPSVVAPPATRWASRILTGLGVLFLTWAAALKLAGIREAVDSTVQLGFRPHHLPIIGLIEIVCLVLFLVPRTAVLGAVLWTGYLGGAIVTHLRVENPLFSHTLFPIYVAALLWGGLYLRDPRVRALLRPAR